MKPLQAAITAAVIATAPAAFAYPDKTITIVVPTAAGGGNDAMARTIAQKLGPLLGQTIIIDNRAGANGSIASEFVARATPDGHTLMFGYIATHAMNPALQKLRYDPVADFEPIGLVGYSMGGYGVVNAIGGGFSEASVTGQGAPPNRLLAERTASNARYRSGIDARIKAAIAIASWGMQTGFWDAEGLKGIAVPMLFVAGSADEVAGYEKGTRAIYSGAVNADRYFRIPHTQVIEVGAQIDL